MSGTQHDLGAATREFIDTAVAALPENSGDSWEPFRKTVLAGQKERV